MKNKKQIHSIVDIGEEKTKMSQPRIQISLLISDTSIVSMSKHSSSTGDVETEKIEIEDILSNQGNASKTDISFLIYTYCASSLFEIDIHMPQCTESMFAGDNRVYLFFIFHLTLQMSVRCDE